MSPQDPTRTLVLFSHHNGSLSRTSMAFRTLGSSSTMTQGAPWVQNLWHPLLRTSFLSQFGFTLNKETLSFGLGLGIPATRPYHSSSLPQLLLESLCMGFFTSCPTFLLFSVLKMGSRSGYVFKHRPFSGRCHLGKVTLDTRCTRNA